MTFSRNLNGSYGMFLLSGLLVLMASSLTWAAPVTCPPALGSGFIASGLCVTPPGNKSILEGTANVLLDFRVTNTTNQILLLDYALATINSGPPDPGDFIEFSGNNGDQGLVGAPVFLNPGATGDFIYSVTSPFDGPECPSDCDFGTNTVSFSIEMSPFNGNINNLPNPNDIFVAVAHGFYFDLTPLGTVPNAAVLAQLLAFQDPTNPAPGALLYPTLNAIIGLSTITGTSPTITTVLVFDTPEPSTWLLLGSGLVGLAVWRQRRSI